MEDNSSQELIAEGNRHHNIRKRKLVDGLVENDSCTERAVTREQSTASETGSNTSISKKPTEQCSSTVTKKQKKCTAQKPKLIPKSKRVSLAMDLGKTEPYVLLEEIKSLFTSQFSDNRCLGEFVAILCKNDQPLYSIVIHHRDDFARLYVDCDKSPIHFQLDWYAHCSAFLLGEDMTLAAVGFDESNVKYSSLVNTRKTWIQFCRDNSTTISDSKPVMIAISSAVYNYLLKQVSVYQKSLTGQPSGREISEGLSATYRDDDVYYHFGGGALCDMLKNRYKQIKNCPSTHRNLLSIEISLLQAINNKDKSSIPAYLKFRDRGYMYFPHNRFLPFLRNLDTLIKTVVNDEGFTQHGDELIKVYKIQYACTSIISASIILVCCVTINCS